jgi:hypothetical protein
VLRPELPTWLVGDVSFTIAPGLELVGNALVDSDGMRYPLNDSARILCEVGRFPADVATVVDLVSAWTDEPREQVDAQVRRFVVDLSALGLLSVHQSHAREAVEVVRSLPMVLSAMVLDRRIAYRGRFPLRKYPATARTVLVGALEAHQGLCWLGVGLAAVLAVLLGTNPITSLNVLQTATAVQVVGSVLAFFLALVATIVAHEWGHLLAARATASDAYAFYVRAGACGLSFRAPSRRARALVVLAGPAGGVCAALAALAVALGLPADLWVWLGLDQLRAPWAAGMLVLALYHLSALTPLAKDGRQLLGMRLARTPGVVH